MNIEIRIYKLFDTDLVALVDNGFPVTTMMREAVIGYAHGTPVFYKMDEHIYFDMNRKKNVRIRFDIPDSDKQTIYLLKNIKHGYRNSFCKMVLRNALTQQNLSGYFAKHDLLKLQEVNAQQIPIPDEALSLKEIMEEGKSAINTYIGFVPPSNTPKQEYPSEVLHQEAKPPTNKKSHNSEHRQANKPSHNSRPRHTDNDDVDILAAFDAL